MIHSGTLDTEDTFKSGDRAADLFAPASTTTGMIGMSPLIIYSAFIISWKFVEWNCLQPQVSSRR